MINSARNTEIMSDVAIIFSVCSCSLAPIAWESRIAVPFVMPIANEFKIRIMGVELVSAAYAVSPRRFPIHRLSIRLYAMFRNIAAIMGRAIASKQRRVLPLIKSICVFIE